MKIYLWCIYVVCFFSWMFGAICFLGSHNNWMALMYFVIALMSIVNAYGQYILKTVWELKLNKDIRCMIGWHRWTWKLQWDEIIYLKQIPDRAVCSRCGAKYKED